MRTKNKNTHSYILTIILVITCVINGFGQKKKNTHLSQANIRFVVEDTVCTKPARVHLKSILSPEFKSADDAMAPENDIAFDIQAVDNSYDIKISPLNKARYVTFNILDNYNPYWIVMPNDNCIIKVTKSGKSTFWGKDATKYKVQYDLFQTELRHFEHEVQPDAKSAKKYFQYLDTLALDQLQVLKSNQPNLPKQFADLLKVEIIGRCQALKQFFFKQGDKETLDLKYKQLLDYKDPVATKKMMSELVNSKNLKNNISLVRLAINQYLLNSAYLNHNELDVNDLCKYLVADFSGTARDWAIFESIQPRIQLYDVSDAISTSLPFVSNASLKKYLIKIKKQYTKGKKAYDFTLKNINGSLTKLSDLKGKVVLIDFYKHTCSACEGLHTFLDTFIKTFPKDKFAIVAVFLYAPSQNDSFWKEITEKELYSSFNNINLKSSYFKGVPDYVKDKYNVYGTPTMVLVGKDGTLLRKPRPYWEDGGKDLKAVIEEAMAKPVPTQ